MYTVWKQKEKADWVNAKFLYVQLQVLSFHVELYILLTRLLRAEFGVDNGLLMTALDFESNDPVCSQFRLYF